MQAEKKYQFSFPDFAAIFHKSQDMSQQATPSKCLEKYQLLLAMAADKGPLIRKENTRNNTHPLQTWRLVR